MAAGWDTAQSLMCVEEFWGLIFPKIHSNFSKFKLNTLVAE